MADIKTRDVVKGTIKKIDKAAALSRLAKLTGGATGGGLAAGAPKDDPFAK